MNQGINSQTDSEVSALGYPTLLVGGQESYESITQKIESLTFPEQHGKGWLLGFGVAFALVMILFLGVAYLFYWGVGVWGVNIPVAWGFAIVNFVWWIGIGHAGTLISAILLLMFQKWRNSINRLAEAMTLFAVACAGMFPLLHLGRPWLFYWLLPYPDTMGLWPQFRSPLVWDVFAVGTYFTVSLLFWYTGLIPDFATLRDRALKSWKQKLYGVLAWGWRGSAIHWKRYQTAYLLLAGLSTPLVVSVHSVVSFDFSVSILPGWHTTIFPPYFVAGAIYSGFSMVLTIIIPVRKIYHLENFITLRHLNNMGNVMLATGLIVAYGYLMETFFAWYSGEIFEQYLIVNRSLGPYGIFYWMLILFNIAIPQFLWVRRVRTHLLSLFLVALSVNFGMWLERFVIVIVSLHRDFLPSSWGMYFPSVNDWALLFGSIGLFIALIFLFIRFFPIISMFEMRELLAAKEEKS
ncbi:MAG: polysulfide reductase NrfD [Verrucomicrobiae bacterium]|nr:polysulfide reductase NrfD [Verrucomicrobiae bacterium]